MLDFGTQKDVTLLVTGLARNKDVPIDMKVILDDFTLPSDDKKAKVRFIHAVPNAPNVDVRLLDGTLLFENVGYGAATEYKELHQGLYTVDVFKSGTSQRLLRVPRVKIEGGNIYSIFAEGTIGNLIAKVAHDYFPPPVSALRIIQASPNLGRVDLTLDGAPLFNDINFKESSGYQKLHPGSYEVRVLPHNQLEPIYLDSNIYLKTSSAYTYLVTGERNSSDYRKKIDSIFIEDDIELPDSNDIKIRMIHACVHCPPLEIRANGVVLFNNVSYRQISEYQLMEASRYSFHVFQISRGHSLQSFDLDLRTHKDKSAVYTLVATGHDLDSLSIVSFRDYGSEPPKSEKKKKKSKSGIIALSVILSVIVVLVAILGTWLYVRKRRTAGYERLA